MLNTNVKYNTNTSVGGGEDGRSELSELKIEVAVTIAIAVTIHCHP